MPLIYRGVNDPERILAGLNGHDTPISHFTAMVHANTDTVSFAGNEMLKQYAK